MVGWILIWRVSWSVLPGEFITSDTIWRCADPPRGPITELMKTPSRTQTVKKTRAMTTAMKERTDKINKINLHLGSPLSKASPSVCRIYLH